MAGVIGRTVRPAVAALSRAGHLSQCEVALNNDVSQTNGSYDLRRDLPSYFDWRNLSAVAQAISSMDRGIVKVIRRSGRVFGIKMGRYPKHEI